MGLNKMSSTELGSLWMTHQKKTLIMRMLEYFIETEDDQKAKDHMVNLHEDLGLMVTELMSMLKNEGAALPIGFTKADVNLNAPRLFENGFHIMFCRILKEISMGMYVLHMTTSYRADIVIFYQRLSTITQSYYNLFTQYLLENGLLPHPTYITMPQSAGYITDQKYIKGTNLLGHKRTVNAVEFGLLYHGLESNITGMQLMKGFAQCAKDEEVKKYFTKGQELSKEIIKETEQLLIQDDIQPPATPGGTVTNSTESPFSDKLMMFCAYLLSGFSLGGIGFSAALSLRRDIMVRSGIFGKDTYEYAIEGANLMMNKGWFEEPPKMDL